MGVCLGHGMMIGEKNSEMNTRFIWYNEATFRKAFVHFRTQSEEARRHLASQLVAITNKEITDGWRDVEGGYVMDRNDRLLLLPIGDPNEPTANLCIQNPNRNIRHP